MCYLNSPPVWHSVCCFLQVGFTYDQRYGIENFAVNLSLAAQPFQRVFITFDFVALKAAIDDSYVGANSTTSQPKLLYDNGSGIISMHRVQSDEKHTTNVSVSHAAKITDGSDETKLPCVYRL